MVDVDSDAVVSRGPKFHSEILSGVGAGIILSAIASVLNLGVSVELIAGIVGFLATIFFLHE